MKQQAISNGYLIYTRKKSPQTKAWTHKQSDPLNPRHSGTDPRRRNTPERDPIRCPATECRRPSPPCSAPPSAPPTGLSGSPGSAPSSETDPSGPCTRRRRPWECWGCTRSSKRVVLLEWSPRPSMFYVTVVCILFSARIVTVKSVGHVAVPAQGSEWGATAGEQRAYLGNEILFCCATLLREGKAWDWLAGWRGLSTLSRKYPCLFP